MLNEDYKEMLQLLSEEQVDFMIVGAYALGTHGYGSKFIEIKSPNMAVQLTRATAGLLKNKVLFCRSLLFGGWSVC